MKISFIEPAILLNAFAMTLTIPLTAQYVYRRIWEETGNYTFASNSNGSECDQNKSSSIFAFREEVQKKASLFNLQVEMSALIPGLVSTFMLLASSDNHGRKLPMVLSSLGSLGTNTWLCMMSYFDLPLQLLIASTFIGALFGNYTTFWGACFAYIVDQQKEYKHRIIRIAILDFMLGVVTGLTGLSSGYFIRELGFVWSYFITAMVLIVNLAYILFFLNDPIKESSSQIVTMSCIESLKDLFYRTYMLFKNGSSKRQALLCLLIFTLVIYFFVIIGISPIFTLYELGPPLCWNEVYIGYGSALGSVSFLSSFLGIWLFSYCLKDIHIAYIGIFTTMVGMTLAAFTRTTLMMFLVRIPFIFTIMPLSVLRSMLSKVVHSTEQGALFACIAFLETLAGVTSTSAYSGIYSATVAWYPGFIFLLSAGLLVLPAISLCCVKSIGWEEGSYTLLVHEEPSEHTSD
ncbi:lysosomal proton-coupled steroid conjugate and bile acid symporter SLC46A3 isoform X2 [Mus musculus]|uniref:Lysosomal proton-coupled steroid conjugate and bile acid symporter SLC46A3 n=2 Tax=Mus musculus TaxID=10090 RepID=S46A3_MOUSE|nr:lysosomal proton-coupled steroid conjugate and bile acid symporter SLC46A3 precursor [Mus musculus]NP_082148.1 lysosomal proton-coupled steroid conjugate and bile acid symporter SLC46A3 precursor [Mus musculus]XP_006504928.1 solute carrier family 46 member 3 isoform X1 [Mus musculus]XP_006504930.1 solute carrier family 46 member 3 isoform X2 [Mus musculus]Q9DC26.1 RecName: Full=Lysosomal proton-coupled steroid conjugate and bile acid symporter SLC46A3; AltName: Full=Solute carrier family 46 |eukprot:NP_082148.1 solute carrier family 46 member 3 precursor [Mus musculus]